VRWGILSAWVLAAAVLLSPLAEAAGQKMKVSGTANLNTATAAQLELVPGIGPKAAEQILAFREKHPFKAVDDLTKMKGFKKKRLEKLRPFLSVSGETTLKEEKIPSAQGRAAPEER